MDIAFGIIGGLGLFLYGMSVMSKSLQKVAGDKLKTFIGMLTNNRLMGVVVGTLVTAIVQSSSATTVMIVGFVNAGIMQLNQAVGVIMGANIGTTVTALIISFKIHKYAPVIVGIAVAVWLFTENRRTKQIAEACIGFGILFVGMMFMGDALRPLRTHQPFIDLLVSFGEHQILGILAGFAITVAVQSSTASTGILLALAIEGLVPISSGLPILFGINIGTTITAMLSSIGANIAAKRAAAVHFMFNIAGALLFIFILQYPLYWIINIINPGNVTGQIATAHIIFNITNTLILLPFAGVFVYLSKKIVPGEEEEIKGIKYIDDRILETPSIALVTTIREVLHMGNVAKQTLDTAFEGFFDNNQKKIDESLRLEQSVNELDRELSTYLVKLSNTSLSKRDRERVDGLFHTINDLERIGDHAENIAELAQYKIDNKLSFSETAIDELNNMKDIVISGYLDSLTAMKNLDVNLAMKVIETEGRVDNIERTLRTNHIARLNKQLCNTSSGILFLDFISNLERISDHASNIAEAVIEEMKRAS